MRPVPPAIRPIATLLVTGLIVGLVAAPTTAAPTSAPSVAPPSGDPAPVVAPVRWIRGTLPDAPEGVELMDVVAGGPGFIAVGGGFQGGHDLPVAEIWTSLDGLAWTRVALEGDAASGQIRSITATPTGFVAVGGRCCPDQALTWRSVDGLAWELAPATADLAGAAMLDVTALPDGALVAIGCSATMECSGGLAWRSEDDGRTWSQAVALTWLPLAVTSAAGGVVAVGASEPYDGAPVGGTSLDGLAWDRTDLPVTNGSLTGLLGYPEGALAVGARQARAGDPSGSLVAGTDGVTWQVLDTGSIERASFDDAVWLGGTPTTGTGGLLVVGMTQDGATRPAAWWSTDGASWSRVRFPRGQGLVHAIAADAAGAALAVGIAALDGTWVSAAWLATADPGG